MPNVSDFTSPAVSLLPFPLVAPCSILTRQPHNLITFKNEGDWCSYTHYNVRGPEDRSSPGFVSLLHLGEAICRLHQTHRGTSRGAQLTDLVLCLATRQDWRLVLPRYWASRICRSAPLV